MASIERIREKMSAISALKENVEIVAVTKHCDLDTIKSAYDAGARHFGENKVQELCDKAAHFESEGFRDIHWHFIGHLQSNKVNKLASVKNLFAIHSIDSFDLLGALLAKGEEFISKDIKCFIQMNTSGEDEKTGFKKFNDIEDCYLDLKGSGHSTFNLYGLMTMGKIRTNDFEKDANLSFSKLSRFKDDFVLKYPHVSLKLSMGMSQDFKIALDHGADWLRIGTHLFK
ncbi:MAG: pyridoxal phosphate enzyme (YggS family) [Parvicellaceae bacterium]|jgi:pyridoxal phosphate enzyme (YggS family)